VSAERFLAEIRVTANLHHPNLLPLFHSGVRPRLDVARSDTLFVDSYRAVYDVFPGGQELLMIRGRASSLPRLATITR